MFLGRSESSRVLSSDMAKESSCDLLLNGLNNHTILLSDEVYAEELQLQEALQVSMISSQTNEDEPSSSSPSLSMALQPTTPALAGKEGESSLPLDVNRFVLIISFESKIL